MSARKNSGVALVGTVAVLAMAAVLCAGRQTARAQCCGDCNGDGQVTITELVTAVNSTLAECPACVTKAQIRVTGQTKCWDASGNEIACAGTGQDGELHLGAARSYTNNGNGTITDNATSLMWEAKSDDESVHDKDNKYTWDAAFAFVRGLNAASFAGYSDWRLPNVNELQSLANYGLVNPAIDPAFNTNCAASCTVTTCSCTQSFNYWSSTTDQHDPLSGWAVTFDEGRVGYNFKSSHTNHARAVRSAVLPGCGLGVPACTLPPPAQ